MNDNGDLSLEQMEQLLRDRILYIDTEQRACRQQRAQLMDRIKNLEVEKVRAYRMLPRAPRVRRKTLPVD